MVSRMPPISPARTSWVKSSSKTLGCWESASAKVEPDSTPDLHVREHPAELAVVGLRGDDLEPLHERQAGVDHHRELPGEDEDVLGGDPAEPGDLDVDLPRLPLHLDGLEPHLREARLHRPVVAGLHLARADLALATLRLPLPHGELSHRGCVLGPDLGGRRLCHEPLAPDSRPTSLGQGPSRVDPHIRLQPPTAGARARWSARPSRSSACSSARRRRWSGRSPRRP